MVIKHKRPLIMHKREQHTAPNSWVTDLEAANIYHKTQETNKVPKSFSLSLQNTIQNSRGMEGQHWVTSMH